MLRVTVVIFLILNAKFAITQDSLQPNIPIYPSTEVLISEIQEYVSSTLINENDSLTYYLGKWESIAGRSEAIERVKILQAISQNRFKTDDYTYYYKYFISEYIWRTKSASKENYKQIYDEYKKHLSYIPLNSKFDAWTKSISKQLLKKKISGSDEYLICLLLSGHYDTFDDLVRTKQYKSSIITTTYSDSPYNYRPTEGLYKLYVGQWLPLGRLNQDFSPSLNIGFSFGLPLKLKYRIEAKFQFVIAPEKSELEFRFDDIKYKTSDLTIICFGFRFTKEHKISNGFFFDTSTEINLNILETNIKDRNGENENSTHGVETIDIGLGIGLKKLLRGNNAIGIETFLHVTPYSFNHQLQSKSGFLSLSTCLFFSF